MDKDTLYKYFSHQATDEERRQVRAWVESSPENMQKYMSERAFYDSVTLLAEPEAPAVRRFSLRTTLIHKVSCDLYLIEVIPRRNGGHGIVKGVSPPANLICGDRKVDRKHGFICFAGHGLQHGQFFSVSHDFCHSFPSEFLFNPQNHRGSQPHSPHTRYGCKWER